jgi:hypothetical protein
MGRSPAAAAALLCALLLAAAGYVRVAWWAARRWGPGALWIAWLASTLLAAGAAAALRGQASPDELVAARPSRAWAEAAGLAAILAMPAFGLAALSVRSRLARSPAGPAARDWAARVGAAAIGAAIPAILLVLLVLALWA